LIHAGGDSEGARLHGAQLQRGGGDPGQRAKRRKAKGAGGVRGDALPGGQRDQGPEQKREGQAEPGAHLRGPDGADGAGGAGLCGVAGGLRGGGCEGGSDPEAGHSLAV